MAAPPAGPGDTSTDLALAAASIRPLAKRTRAAPQKAGAAQDPGGRECRMEPTGIPIRIPIVAAQGELHGLPPHCCAAMRRVGPLATTHPGESPHSSSGREVRGHL